MCVRDQQDRVGRLDHQAQSTLLPERKKDMLGAPFLPNMESQPALGSSLMSSRFGFIQVTCLSHTQPAA